MTQAIPGWSDTLLVGFAALGGGSAQVSGDHSSTYDCFGLVPCISGRIERPILGLSVATAADAAHFTVRSLFQIYHRAT